MKVIQDFLCSIGKHDWEEIETIQEVTFTREKIRICKNCCKGQKCKEKRGTYTEWN